MDSTLSGILGTKPLPDGSEKALFAKAAQYAKLVSWIPGIRMIAVCNSLSMYASDGDSDIDLFVVANPGRMWLVRTLLTGIFHAMGVRRHGTKIAGRFCLSFFATTQALDLSKIAIENDAYLHAWAEHLKPILDIGNCYDLLIEQNAHWVTVDEARKADNLTFLTVRKPESKERLKATWDWLERTFSRMFLPKTLREYERLGKPWGIVISETMLKFHRNDRREEIREAYESELRSSGQEKTA